MNVLLLNPWQLLHDTTVSSFGPAWPLGLLYVAAATQAAGHEVTIFDAAVGGKESWIFENAIRMQYIINEVDGISLKLVGTFPKMLPEIVKAVCPDIVGISLSFSSQHCLISYMVESIKKSAPNSIIVLGGTHATLASDMLIEEEGIDYVITGEGEISFPALLNTIENGKEPKGMPGVCYKDGENKQFDLITDVDALPFPAFGLVPKHSYSCANNKVLYQILSSRGCPFNCRFCSAPFLTRRTWRPHSVERVLAEIEMCVNRRAEEIRFTDDNATIDKDRFKSILEGIITSGWKVELSGYSFHCQTLDKEMLSLMRLAGFKRVMFAPESGNDRVIREEIGKTFTVADAENTIKDITNAGLIPYINILIGMPGETRNEIADTIEFCRRAKEINPECGAWVSCATPMLGTELYDEAVEKGLYPGGIPEIFSYTVATYDGIDWTKEELSLIRERLMINMNGHL